MSSRSKERRFNSDGTYTDIEVQTNRDGSGHRYETTWKPGLLTSTKISQKRTDFDKDK